MFEEAEVPKMMRTRTSLTVTTMKITMLTWMLMKLMMPSYKLESKRRKSSAHKPPKDS